MKVKILGKYIGKTGIESALVSVDNKDVANELAIKASGIGATKDQISALITAKDYKGVIGYSFFINCSKFTFERIEKFGILDCNIICGISAKGFLYAKIEVIDRKEQVFGYEAPEEDVTGWVTSAPTVKEVQPLVNPDLLPPTPFEVAQNNSLNPSDANDLPFN